MLLRRGVVDAAELDRGRGSAVLPDPDLQRTIRGGFCSLGITTTFAPSACFLRLSVIRDTIAT